MGSNQDWIHLKLQYIYLVKKSICQRLKYLCCIFVSLQNIFTIAKKSLFQS